MARENAISYSAGLTDCTALTWLCDQFLDKIAPNDEWFDVKINYTDENVLNLATWINR